MASNDLRLQYHDEADLQRHGRLSDSQEGLSETNSTIDTYSTEANRAKGGLHDSNITEHVTKTSGKDKQENSSETHPSLPFYKLFIFATPYDYLLMGLGTIGAIAHGLTLPIFFLFFGKLINSFGENQNDPQKAYHEVSKYALYFVYLALSSFVSSWIEVACWMQSGERQVERMRIEYLKAILNQEISFFDTQARTGNIVDNISTGTLVVQGAISEKLGSFIHYVSTFLGGFFVGFGTLWRIGLVTLAMVPVIAAVGALYVMSITGLTSKSHKAHAEAGFIAEQAISQIRTIFSFVGESKVLSSYSKALKLSLSLGYQSGAAKGFGVGSLYGVLYCVWALLLWYGGVQVRQYGADGGKALASIFAVLIGGIALGQASPPLAAFAKASSAGYPVIRMIERKPTRNNGTSMGIQLNQVRGEIELRNVTFSYPSRPDVHVFEDFSLIIPPGKTVAIVGSSGSGKSTVISLIERFYDPTSGEVLLDGHNIKTLQLRWLRSCIGLVNQEPSLFATTILENILHGKPTASYEEIESAAKAVNAHAFITQLPGGYKTQVGDKGAQLSGGQKQRIALARAMLKNPAILLLDEATSALDAESERVIQDALDKVMLGRTTVVVAHRLSTIQNADFIAVVQNGRIVELGNHEDLIVKHDGAYATLVHLQEMTKGHSSTEIHPGLSRYECGSTGDRRLNRDSQEFGGKTSESGKIHEVIQRGPEKENEPKISKSYFWRLMKLNAAEWPFGLLGSIGAMLAGLVTPVFALIIGQVLHLYYEPDFRNMKNEIRKYALIYVGIAAIAFVACCLEHYCFGIMGENLTNRVREVMLRVILQNELGWFDCEENSSTQLGARLASDVTNVRAAVGDRISITLQNLTLVTGAYTIAFIIQWRLAFVVSATFPLIVGAAFVEALFLKGFAGDIARSHYRATMLAGEAVSNIRTVAAFNAEEKVVQLVSQELIAPKRSATLRGHAAGLGFGVSSLLMFSSYGLGLWYGALLFKHGYAVFGDVMKCFLVLVITAFAVAETVSLTPEIVKSGQALTSIFGILDRESKINPDDPQSEDVKNVKGDVELRNVEFQYPSRPQVTIFKCLNLQVCSGQSLALVGASGSGKSSVIALIERFYDPISGHVLIDGKDIRRLNLKSLRRHIGLVQQEPALFASDIYENIVFGKEGASESEVVEAAKAANADHFISALPKGYKTFVGEGGVQLSGGQKQRVAIARAVLKNPAILLLDEATSALDADSEHIVQAALDQLMKHRTSITVAHRLSTIRNADQIAVIEEGAVIEQGTHLELVGKPDGAYSKLIRLQHVGS